MSRREFIGALNELRLAKGLSYAQVAARAGKQLPKSTAHALCTKQFPKREEQLRAFLTGCGEPPETHHRWVELWQAASRANERPRPQLSWSKARPGVPSP